MLSTPDVTYFFAGFLSTFKSNTNHNFRKWRNVYPLFTWKLYFVWVHFPDSFVVVFFVFKDIPYPEKLENKGVTLNF